MRESRQEAYIKVILDVLADGKVHGLDDIRIKLNENNFENSKENKDALRNALFKLNKKEKKIINVSKGKYKLNLDNNSLENKEKYAECNDNNVNDKDDLDIITQIENMVDSQIKEIEKINWISCPNSELLEAKKSIDRLLNIARKIEKLYD